VLTAFVIAVLESMLSDTLLDGLKVVVKKIAGGSKTDAHSLKDLLEIVVEKRKSAESAEVARELCQAEIGIRSVLGQLDQVTVSLGKIPPTAQGCVAEAALRDVFDRAAEAIPPTRKYPTDIPPTRRYQEVDLSGIRVPYVAPLPADDLTGRDLSGYTLKEPVGHGGFGVVYRAVNVFGKTVAIKVPHHPSQIERLVKEAKALARLRHEHIVSVENIVPRGDPPHLICEYVDGNDLAKTLLSEGPLDEKATEGVLLGVLEALDHAHSQGVLHLDLKPANLIVTRSEPRKVKVLDFGIGRLVANTQSALSHSLTLTRSGVVGTLDYMSPEQRAGIQDLDGRADFYSLAVTLYQLLVGRCPSGAARLKVDSPGLRRFFEAAYQDNREDRPTDAPEALRLVRRPGVVDGEDTAAKLASQVRGQGTSTTPAPPIRRRETADDVDPKSIWVQQRNLRAVGQADSRVGCAFLILAPLLSCIGGGVGYAGLVQASWLPAGWPGAGAGAAVGFLLAAVALLFVGRGAAPAHRTRRTKIGQDPNARGQEILDSQKIPEALSEGPRRLLQKVLDRQLTRHQLMLAVFLGHRDSGAALVSKGGRRSDFYALWETVERIERDGDVDKAWLKRSLVWIALGFASLYRGLWEDIDEARVAFDATAAWAQDPSDDHGVNFRRLGIEATEHIRSLPRDSQLDHTRAYAVQCVTNAAHLAALGFVESSDVMDLETTAERVQRYDCTDSQSPAKAIGGAISLWVVGEGPEPDLSKVPNLFQDRCRGCGAPAGSQERFCGGKSCPQTQGLGGGMGSFFKSLFS
jgi:serine/threonine protein kinase